MIDWEQVATLRAEVGEADFEEVVELFLSEVDGAINRLKNYEGPRNIAEDLHFLKGSALGLGFRAFSDLCRTGEVAAERDNLTRADMMRIFDCYDTSRSLFLSQIGQRLAG